MEQLVVLVDWLVVDRALTSDARSYCKIFCTTYDALSTKRIRSGLSVFIYLHLIRVKTNVAVVSCYILSKRAIPPIVTLLL